MLKVYTVWDSASDAFLQPFYTQSKGQAIRSFTDAANDSGHQFCKHPEDFTLFELGEFNEQDAKFVLHPSPVSIGLAVEFKKRV